MVFPTLFPGSLSVVVFLQEFCKIFQQFFPFGDPSAFAALIFDQLDVSEKGLIEFREFVTALSTASRGTTEEKLTCKSHVCVFGKGSQVTSFRLSQSINQPFDCHDHLSKQPAHSGL